MGRHHGHDLITGSIKQSPTNGVMKPAPNVSKGLCFADVLSATAAGYSTAAPSSTNESQLPLQHSSALITPPNSTASCFTTPPNGSNHYLAGLAAAVASSAAPSHHHRRRSVDPFNGFDFSSLSRSDPRPAKRPKPSNRSANDASGNSFFGAVVTACVSAAGGANNVSGGSASSSGSGGSGGSAGSKRRLPG